MKAYLIVDLPDGEDINECVADMFIHDLYVRGIAEYNDVPLRPLPEKNKYDVEKYATADYENDITLGHYLNKGWNDCLDEILGEKE